MWDHEHLRDIREMFRSVKTGDILLFESWSINSLFVKACTWSRWTHVGIAVWLDTYYGPQLYCFESSNNFEYDSITNTVKDGCRLSCVTDLLHKASAVGRRPLNIKRDQKYFIKLKEFIMKWSNTKFKANFGSMFFSSVGYMVDKDPPNIPFITYNPNKIQQGVFCSEIVSIYLADFGLLSAHHVLQFPHERVTPKMLADDPLFTSSAVGIFGDISVIYDAKISDSVKVCLFAIYMASLFLYILLTVDAEREESTRLARRSTSTTKIRKSNYRAY